MLPGLTTTRAAAIVLDAEKFLLSAMRTLPPLFSYIGLTSDMRKIAGVVAPHSTPAATWSASRSPGSSPGKIHRLCSGMSSKVSWATRKFLASTSGGVWANQSVSSSVLLSDWAPSSNASTNSAPSGPMPCREWGRPVGKNQRSPAKTSSTLGFPSRLRVVIRHLPSVIRAHSAVWCQCSSRMPPVSRYMFTPAISVEIAKSGWVTSRAQPPRCWRRGEMLNEDQKNGWVLMSVPGAVITLGNWLSRTGLRGPPIVVLAGSPVLVAMPSGGRSGLPKVAVSCCGTGFSFEAMRCPSLCGRPTQLPLHSTVIPYCCLPCLTQRSNNSIRSGGHAPSQAWSHPLGVPRSRQHASGHRRRTIDRRRGALNCEGHVEADDLLSLTSLVDDRVQRNGVKY